MLLPLLLPLLLPVLLPLLLPLLLTTADAVDVVVAPTLVVGVYVVDPPL